MLSLKQGIKIESEHKRTYNKISAFVKKNKKLPSKNQFFKLIAKDHIREFPNYYPNLIRMERKLKR